MARPKEPDMPPQRTKKVRLGIYPKVIKSVSKICLRHIVWPARRIIRVNKRRKMMNEKYSEQSEKFGSSDSIVSV